VGHLQGGGFQFTPDVKQDGDGFDSTYRSPNGPQPQALPSESLEHEAYVPAPQGLFPRPLHKEEKNAGMLRVSLEYVMQHQARDLLVHVHEATLHLIKFCWAVAHGEIEA
jgi:hypothetical protein